MVTNQTLRLSKQKNLYRSTDSLKETWLRVNWVWYNPRPTANAWKSFMHGFEFQPPWDTIVRLDYFFCWCMLKDCLAALIECSWTVFTSLSTRSQRSAAVRKIPIKAVLAMFRGDREPTCTKTGNQCPGETGYSYWLRSGTDVHGRPGSVLGETGDWCLEGTRTNVQGRPGGTGI